MRKQETLITLILVPDNKYFLRLRVGHLYMISVHKNVPEAHFRFV